MRADLVTKLQAGRRKMFVDRGGGKRDAMALSLRPFLTEGSGFV